MTNKKTKSGREKNYKTTKQRNDYVTYFIATVIGISVIVGGAISGLYSSTWGGNAIAFGNTTTDNMINNIIFAGSPSQTFYLSSKLFPIVAIGGYGGNVYGPNWTIAKYIFYGTPQANGTECISGVEVYLINPVNNSFSSIPEVNTTNPKEVAKLYYYSQIYFSFDIKPNKYTLLCPDIVNTIKR